MAETVFGLELEQDDLEEGALANSVVVVVEVIDEHGKPSLRLMNSEPMTMWTQLGMLRAAVLEVEKELQESWQSDP
jgi:hypothetical protein